MGWVQTGVTHAEELEFPPSPLRGRLVQVFEDRVGFLTQHRLLDRTESDRDVAVPETRRRQQRFQNQVEELSLDRGFHWR